MPDAEHKDFFISYNKADKAWAEWIAWELEVAGYACVLQAWDFRPGGNFVLEMDKAAKLAKRTIAVLSPDYITSEFTQPEWAAAFKKDPTGGKRLLVPVRVRSLDVEGLLGQTIYIDLVGLDEVAAREILIAGLEKRGKPAFAPGFPGKKPSKEAPRFPGALPAIWNVPHQRNPNFTGRDQLLKDLRESLTSGQVAALTALHGLGGVGKTQTALEYAYRFAWDYDLVWWVRSEDPVTLATEYAALAGPLNLPEKDAAEQEVAIAAVRRALGQQGRWLLIFDNASEPKDLKAYRPQGNSGHILITSRNPAWRGVAQPLDVKKWERPEAVAFLLKRTGQRDEAAANELARELGDLPLALEQAGAYIEECGCSIGHYLELFRSRRQELMRRGDLQSYPDPVATTWEVSIQKVQAASPAAADLLNLCAFLAPDDIPKELLVEGVEELPEPLAAAVQDPLAFDDALAILRRYSLMEVSGDFLAIHRLVQAVVRERLDENSKKRWAGAAVKMVNAAFPGNIQTNVSAWPWCARLLPQALTAAGHTEALRSALPAAAEALNLCGFYLWIRAEFSEARHAFEGALAIREKIHGLDHPEVAIVLSNLGSVLRAQGYLSEARQYHERALAIDEAYYGADHAYVAIRLNNLGLALEDLGDLPGAKRALERALAIDQAEYGSNHPKVANRLNNLGDILRALGDLSEARAYFERALAILEKGSDLTHPYIATVMNNLGSVLADLGDLDGARTHYERALALEEVTYDPNHLNVAIPLNNLGMLFHTIGDLDGAKAHLERALAICRQFLGEDHPDTQIVKKNLDSLISSQA